MYQQLESGEAPFARIGVGQAQLSARSFYSLLGSEVTTSGDHAIWDPDKRSNFEGKGFPSLGAMTVNLVISSTRCRGTHR